MMLPLSHCNLKEALEQNVHVGADASQQLSAEEKHRFLMKEMQAASNSAHEVWDKVVRPGDTVVETSCDGGWRALYLSALVGPEGQLHVFDSKVRSNSAIFCSPLLCTSLPLHMLAPRNHGSALHGQCG